MVQHTRPRHGEPQRVVAVVVSLAVVGAGLLLGRGGQPGFACPWRRGRVAAAATLRRSLHVPEHRRAGAAAGRYQTWC